MSVMRRWVSSSASTKARQGRRVDEEDDYAASVEGEARLKRKGREGQRGGQNTILGLDQVYVCMYTHMYRPAGRSQD